MVIEKQPPGVWFLCCDTCGERITLDTDPDDEFFVAVKEAREDHGYRIREESHHFKGHGKFDNAKYGPKWTHTCPDCVSAEPKPTLRQAATMTDLRIELQESRPYRLGYEAFEDGQPRDSNPMWGPNTRPKWHHGWDDAKNQRDADRLGV